MAEHSDVTENCLACVERVEENCQESPLACNHHCNDSWEDGLCCYCYTWVGEAELNNA